MHPVRWFASRGLNVKGRFALTRWFAVVGAVAIGLSSLGLSWLLTSYLESRMLERDAALSRDFVQGIANIQQVVGFFKEPSAAPAPSVAEFFTHVAAMPDVLRANVYAADRHVIWSSKPEMIGKTFGPNDELERALQGEVVVNLDEEGSELPKAEHQGLHAASTGYVENYLPVYEEGSRRLIGVIELYRQPVALLQAIDSGQRLIWLGGMAEGTCLFLVLVGFIRRTDVILQAQQKRLVEVEALGIVGEISAAVAHSIRNPLGSIRSSAELQREITGDADGTHLEIMRNVDRIEHLVRTLLTYANGPSQHQAKTDLAMVLVDAAGRFAPDLELQGKRLETDFGSDLGSVGADPVVLSQIFNSLLANALEATQSGDQVRLSALREGNRARIELGDSGAGIENGRVAEIFRPFYTTKPRGLGLGLALTRRIVERLGGEISVASRVGLGTVILLYLPISPA